MALWARVQQLHGEALQQVGMAYQDTFPIDVRCALAPWIEEQNWAELDPDNPQHDIYIAQIANAFLTELETKLTSVDDFLMRVKLNDAANEFRAKYSNQPQQLVRVIKHCLNTEMRIVQHSEDDATVGAVASFGIEAPKIKEEFDLGGETYQFMRGVSSAIHLAPDPVQEINLALDKLRQKAQESGEDLRKMLQCQEAFVIQYQESSKRQGWKPWHRDLSDKYMKLDSCPFSRNRARTQMQQSQDVDFITKAQKEKHLYDAAVRNQIQELIRLRMKLIDGFQSTFMDLNELQKRILDTELIKWKRAQQLAGNGEPFLNNLDQIQEWCEALADIIWQNRQQIRQVETLASQVPLNIPGNVMEKLPILNNQITGLLSSLVTSTFIIEKQPPQVLKTNTRFAATVRLLVGSKLSVYMTPPQVKVTIISEAQAIALLKNDKVGPGEKSLPYREASGEILNNMGTMEYHQATRQLSVSFRNLQLRKIKRAEKKGTESVMDEKFSLLFQSQFKVGGGELVFQVWTLSLPVVVIVHGNQDPHAWATITWDNAFAEPGRVPFQVPEKVSWKEVADVLNTKFKANTGRSLSEDNLQFLAGKVFRSSVFVDPSAMVTWSQFCKEPLPERNFTFWEWFYATMKVTREHLKHLWTDGLIIGFIGRHQAEEMLLKKCVGTFLLRFSDSEAGGVTIAWVTDSQTREGQEVLMIQPFTSRDFTIRPLADRIYDLKHLQYLYPDIQKDQAFGKYYTPYTGDSNANGYVRPVLVTHLPALANAYGYDSYPNTPQSNLQSPDPGHYDSHSSDMQAGAQFPEVDYDILNMEFAPEVDEPVDFSSINVCDLVSYTHSS